MTFLAVILALILSVLLFSPAFLLSSFSFDRRVQRLVDIEQKREAKENLDQFTHKHSAHWEYIKDLVPWRIRLRLSRFRGKERPLTWRIKLLALFAGLGPQVAEWILEEYMITAKVEEKPAPGEWTCPKCGTHNQETALFCKNCGEYK